MIRVRAGDLPGLVENLQRHPEVELESGSAELLEFWQGDWHRRLTIGDVGDLFGLVELMDNNPMVCADVVSVPDPASTLALIAVGPLIRAGLLVEAPMLMYGFPVGSAKVSESLATMGWTEGATLVEQPTDEPVHALVAMAVIRQDSNFDEIDELYDEAYGRSFFVRRDEDSPWDAASVLGQAHARYALALTPDSPYSLLRIQVMADPHGKTGAAQVVHAMNVMAGFEESLGIA